MANTVPNTATCMKQRNSGNQTGVILLPSCNFRHQTSSLNQTTWHIHICTIFHGDPADCYWEITSTVAVEGKSLGTREILYVHHPLAPSLSGFLILSDVHTTKRWLSCYNMRLFLFYYLTYYLPQVSVWCLMVLQTRMKTFIIYDACVLS